MEMQMAQNSQNKLEKEQQELVLPDCKTCYKATVIKIIGVKIAKQITVTEQ